ncbi:reverse transcriptase, partial [Globisporangium splendens]
MDASPAQPLLSTFAHNAKEFQCALCDVATRDHASLRRHRQREHRLWTFSDVFYCDCDCDCARAFTARLAATNHARTCPTASLYQPIISQATSANGADGTADSDDDAATDLMPSHGRSERSNSIDDGPHNEASSSRTIDNGPSDREREKRKSSERIDEGAINISGIIECMDEGESENGRSESIDDDTVNSTESSGNYNDQLDDRHARSARVNSIENGANAHPSSDSNKWGGPLTPSTGIRRGTRSNAATRLVATARRRAALPTATALGILGETDQWMTIADPASEPYEIEITGAKKRRVGDSAPTPRTERLINLLNEESTTDPSDDSDGGQNPWFSGIEDSNTWAPDTEIAASPTPPRETSPQRQEHERTPTDGTGPQLPPARTLQFAGFQRRNSKRTGNAAVILDQDDKIIWQHSATHSSVRYTRTTAAFSALQSGLLAALHHGCNVVELESTDALILEQLAGSAIAHNHRVKIQLQLTRDVLNRFAHWKIRHIDNRTNRHATRLARQAAIDRKVDHACAQHTTNKSECYPTIAHGKNSESESDPASASADEEMKEGEIPSDADSQDEHRAETTRRDARRVYPATRYGITTESTPTRLPRLVLRQLSAEDLEAATEAVDKFATDLAMKIKDAQTWEIGEGYISALAPELRRVLTPYSRQQSSETRADPQPHRTDHLQTRLDEAIADMKSIQRVSPPERKAIEKSRRRVGRLRAAMKRRALRRKFRYREKECVHSILRPSPQTPGFQSDDPVDTSAARCPIKAAELKGYFAEINSEAMPFNFHSPAGEPFRQALEALPQAEHLDIITDAINYDEVYNQLKRASASASPGLDGLPHSIMKKFQDQLIPVLQECFNFCWSHRRIPSAWKMAAVRLIHKKGDALKPDNWRPICLQACIYKLYSGILACRFSAWMDKNKRFTPAQKGFRHFNGCHEHNFISSSLIDQTRRHQRTLYAVWYDLRNAFGSIPQQMLWDVLEAFGVPAEFIDCAKDIYTDSSFVILDPADATTTEPIKQERGVYQGCPLSPYLFLAAISPLLHVLQAESSSGITLGAGVTLNSTAYADDIKTFSSSAAGIRKTHALVMRFLKWTSLRANPQKCAFLPVTTGKRAEARKDSIKLEIDGTPIPTIDLSEGYTYLGVNDSYDPASKTRRLNDDLRQLKIDLSKLCRSTLAPSQVIKGIKTYLYPRIEFSLRHLRPPSAQLQGFDTAVNKQLRHLLRLPKTATTSLFYAPTSHGGLGLLPLTDTHTALQIAHGWQMLHSKDANICAVAKSQIMQTIRKRYHIDEQHWKDKEDLAIQAFLNSNLSDSPFASKRKTYTDISSIWVDIQRHLRNLKLKLTTTEENEGTSEHFQLHVPHETKPLSYKTILRHLKLHIKLQYAEKWKAATDQGQTRMRQRSNATCRHPPCTNPETLAHVLNHCPGNSDSIRKRHDDGLEKIHQVLLKNIERSKRQCTIRINQSVPGFTGPALRPDIQIYDETEKTAIISDLAVSFEKQSKDDSNSSTLQCAKDIKILKYEAIRKHLESQGWSVKLSALTYGSLGSTTKGNFIVLWKDFQIRKRDAIYLDKDLSTHHVTCA